jgi:RHS repeat-associated protein
MPVRSVLPYLLVTVALLSLTVKGNAQCSVGPTASCVTGVTISPSTILGDGSKLAQVTVQGFVGGQYPQNFGLAILKNFGSTLTNCPTGETFSGSYGSGCNYPNMGPGYVTMSFSVNGVNSGTTDYYGNIKVYNVADYDNGMSTNVTVTATGSPAEDPTSDPDTTCKTCAAKPINLFSGNTWISQTDYSIPGLGGGLSLSRTWNSLWPLKEGPGISGIFGHSWRSTFEERIQVLTGATVNYWKGDGNALFYAYSSTTNSYQMTAPTDDQTQLAFNSSNNTWVITLKEGTQKIFNSNGYLTSIVDRNGNTTTINVDSSNNNRILSVIDAAGRTLTFNYNNSSYPTLCTSLADSVGTVATYTYDTNGHLTQAQFADGSQQNYAYDTNDLILSVTDSLGKVLEAHTYDSQRRGLTAQEANDSNGKPVNLVTVQYGPWWSPKVTYVQDSYGDNYGDPGVSLSFTNRGQRHYLTGTAGSAPCSTCSFHLNEGFTYSDAGYPTSYTDPNGHTTFYSYDSNGNMISKSLPDTNGTDHWADIWNYTYNSFGEVLTTTDVLGNTTTNQYDSHGNLLSTTTPSPDGVLAGSTTSFTYDSHGQLETITDPLQNVTTLTYYPTGLLRTITDAQNHVTTYAYDARGNRTSVTDANNNETQFQYDSMNRLTLITYPTSPATTVQFHYDYRGRRDQVTDQNSKTTAYAYDDADRLISVTDATNQTTRYVYNTENRLTDIYDANNNHTQFYWEYSDIMYQAVFPSGYSESYNWDGYRTNLTSKTDRNGNSHTYYYDVQNRLYQWDGYLTAAYDPLGRLSQIQSGYDGSTWTFAYDNMGRLTQTGTNYGFDNAGNYVVKYGYDAASNRTSMTDPQNGVTTYTYDTLNRLTNIEDPQSHNFGFSYDALSRRTQLTRPNGVNTNYTYDTLSRLLSVLHQAGNTTLDGAQYSYDAAGNRTSKTDLLANVTSNFAYDDIYQLTGVTQGTSTTESYTYDPVGNRLSSLGVSPYSYNSSNELTSTPSATYTYDKNGSMLTKTDATGTTQYSWDYYTGRLNSVTLPGSGGTVSFKYDPFGRRFQKSFTQGSTTTTTNYLYDGNNLLETVGSNGSLIARYVEGQTVDEPIAQSSSTGTSYYDIDALSSVTSLSNSSGAISSTNTYDSFGNLGASTDTNTNPFRYTGRELDPETGLNFYRARYYDSSIGRFVSEDPLRFRAGVDFYRYVSNDPIDSTDPYGLAQLCCRIARSVYWLGIKGCHCFLKFDDGTTYGGYWKWSTYLLLEKRVNENDDRNPKDPPSCKDVPGSECAMRRAFNDLPRFQPYGLGGTSNSIPAAVLTLSGSQFAMPSCAFGAFPFNLRELGNPGPVPIGSVPNVSF